MLFYMERLLASHLALVDEPLIKYMRKYSAGKPRYVASVCFSQFVAICQQWLQINIL